MASEIASCKRNFNLLIDILKVRINDTGEKQLKFKIDVFFHSCVQ